MPRRASALADRITARAVAASALTVQGTLQPGPAGVPDRGSVSYGGRDYEAYSFIGQAFPSGPLRIALLIRPPPDASER